MELGVVLVVLGGLWAALLLPSFFDSRNDAPLTSTRSFGRGLERLASLKPVDRAALARRRVQARRRRILAALLAVTTSGLVAGLVLGQSGLVVAGGAAGLLLVGYSTVLAMMAGRRRGGEVVELPTPDTTEDRRIAVNR